MLDLLGFTRDRSIHIVKALAEGYESLRQLLGIPAAFVFHAWDEDSMWIDRKSVV